MSYNIVFKRVYEAAERSDGARILVDRLWPRGKRREDLQLTEWYRDASPSPALRRAWHQGEISDQRFADDYRKELDAQPETLVPLMRHARQSRLSLLTASRNPEQSHLPILKNALLDQLAREDDEADDRAPSSPTCYNR
ncbi:DUF488 domain-containing protein [Marinimicrobium sp. LS-A18]|uniref:DUF488 domain-containing protein n=1 Tax=Marinimicrobium sp. LS-A18 TaxID=1381596 RepID=UPI000465FED5|nr:DUF488 family protein [Marinimicrobium sp. LS-A18]